MSVITNVALLLLWLLGSFHYTLLLPYLPAFSASNSLLHRRSQALGCHLTPQNDAAEILRAMQILYHMPCAYYTSNVTTAGELPEHTLEDYDQAIRLVRHSHKSACWPGSTAKSLRHVHRNHSIRHISPMPVMTGQMLVLLCRAPTSSSATLS